MRIHCLLLHSRFRMTGWASTWRSGLLADNVVTTSSMVMRLSRSVYRPPPARNGCSVRTPPPRRDWRSRPNRIRFVLATCETRADGHRSALERPSGGRSVPCRSTTMSLLVACRGVRRAGAGNLYLGLALEHLKLNDIPAIAYFEKLSKISLLKKKARTPY